MKGYLEIEIPLLRGRIDDAHKILQSIEDCIKKISLKYSPF